MAGGAPAPSGVPGSRAMRSYCTPGGKSAAVNTAFSSLAPGQVAVPAIGVAAAGQRRNEQDGQHIPPGHGVSPVAIVGRSRRPVLQQRKHGIDVDMAGEQVGHHVELGVSARADVDVVGDDESASARGRCDLGEPLPPNVVVVEQPVPVGAVDRAAADAHPDACDEPVVLGASD